MMKQNYNNFRYMRLLDICDVERAVKDKIYKKGSTLIPLSGMVSTPLEYLKSDCKVETKYAVVTPKPEHNSRYIFEVIKKEWEEFKARYKTTINLQFSALKHFKIPVHEERETQDEAASIFQLMEIREKELEERIRHMQNLKKDMLGKVFV